MKLIVKTIFLSLFLIGFSNTYAQVSQPDVTPKKLNKIETVEFEVHGVCGMCKKRIENSALIKGVKMVKWNKDVQKIKVIYNTKKTTEEAIHNAIAESGHDTEKVKAKNEVYAKLPGCCAYRDGVKIH